MEGRLKFLAALFGAIAAAFGAFKGCQEFRKSSEERRVAEIKRQTEEDELKKKQTVDQPPVGTPVNPPKPPTVGKKNEPIAQKDGATEPPAPRPTPIKRVISDVLLANTNWEGNADSAELRMEIKEVTGSRFSGKLHWSSGGKLKMTAKMTGRVTDPDQMTFEWRKEDSEFGSGFLPATHTGVVYFESGVEVRGRWAFKVGAGTGSFRLRLAE